jgi:hypothetical protein
MAVEEVEEVEEEEEEEKKGGHTYTGDGQNNGNTCERYTFLH